MLEKIAAALDVCTPFVRVVALAFGVVAAWLALVDAFPFVAQIWRPKGDAQRYALIGAALSVIVGVGFGGGKGGGR